MQNINCVTSMFQQLENAVALFQIFTWALAPAPGGRLVDGSYMFQI